MSNDHLGRRDVLAGLGVVALGTTVGLPIAARLRESGAEITEAAAPDVAGVPLAAPDDPVRALFGGLREGSPVSTHWRLEALHGVRAGAIPVLMSTLEGDRFAVEIFREDPSGAPALASAGALALHIVNRGDGSTPTSELKGLGVMALGRELEARLAAGAPVPEGLTTLGERLARDPGGAFTIPLG